MKISFEGVPCGSISVKTHDKKTQEIVNRLQENGINFPFNLTTGKYAIYIMEDADDMPLFSVTDDNLASLIELARELSSVSWIDTIEIVDDSFEETGMPILRIEHKRIEFGEYEENNEIFFNLDQCNGHCEKRKNLEKSEMTELYEFISKYGFIIRDKRGNFDFALFVYIKGEDNPAFSFRGNDSRAIIELARKLFSFSWITRIQLVDSYYDETGISLLEFTPNSIGYGVIHPMEKSEYKEYYQ